MSDVWAFGVTVWEIFTMGQVPFSQLSYCPLFEQKLKQGLRLGQPRLASDSVLVKTLCDTVLHWLRLSKL